MGKTAIVFGASGLTGSSLVRYLANSVYYSEVKVVVRRPGNIKFLNVKEIVVDFDRIEEYSQQITGDDLFYTLGTTIKVAGSKEMFEKVDLIYPIKIAKIAKQNGIKQFLLMSSLGANEKSSNFYLSIKGRCEKAIEQIGFDILTIYRPSMLLGDRDQFRLGELIAKKIMKLFSFLFVGPLRKYKAIKSRTVAQCMVLVAQEKFNGIKIYESNDIMDITQSDN